MKRVLKITQFYLLLVIILGTNAVEFKCGSELVRFVNDCDGPDKVTNFKVHTKKLSNKPINGKLKITLNAGTTLDAMKSKRCLKMDPELSGKVRTIHGFFDNNLAINDAKITLLDDSSVSLTLDDSGHIGKTKQFYDQDEHLMKISHCAHKEFWQFDRDLELWEFSKHRFLITKDFKEILLCKGKVLLWKIAMIFFPFIQIYPEKLDNRPNLL